MFAVVCFSHKYFVVQKRTKSACTPNSFLAFAWLYFQYFQSLYYASDSFSLIGNPAKYHSHYPCLIFNDFIISMENAVFLIFKNEFITIWSIRNYMPFFYSSQFSKSETFSNFCPFIFR